MTVSPAPAGELLALGQEGRLVEHAARRLGRVGDDGQPVHGAAGVLDREGHLAGLDGGGVGLDPHSPSVVLTSAFMAPMSWPGAAAGAGAGAATFGAPVVCRMPAAPLTMSPKEWVTNG